MNCYFSLLLQIFIIIRTSCTNIKFALLFKNLKCVDVTNKLSFCVIWKNDNNNLVYKDSTQVWNNSIIIKMDYISRKLSGLKSFFTTSSAEVRSPRKLKRNIHLEHIFKILSWNDPFLSWCSILIVNFFYWLIVQLEVKPLGVIFCTILTLFLYDGIFTRNYDTSSDFKLTDEMEQYFIIYNSFISTMVVVRKNNPAIFCSITCVFFLILSFIAKNIPGVLLVYLILMSLFFIPLGYSKLPNQVRTGIKVTLKSLFTSEDVIDEDDLIPLPIPSKTDRNDGDAESLDTDRTADSVTNSLISGLGSMPSFMDADDNNEILEEDLIPLNASRSREVTPGFGETSSDSDSELREMRFKDSHFSKDSSSDEGSKFEEGLYFSEDTNDTTASQPSTKKLVQGIVEYVTLASAELVDNALSNFHGSSKVTRKSSSSDSDFEVINADEVINQ